ncbi:Clp protease N-terminal domain-containing protein [Actinomyces faecalis]|uniref:Clp protease N-terminal domain-containing protein n=1 Tax=Actinomyces faecalis TaxID=2722820 RepID=UPI0015576B79|nr:Clp protease N-terminal domain-containing protein [Actinomyces faecalis]
MRTFSFMLGWVTASRTEALLARHRQIEEIDLLLGLLAQGGTVAQLLGRRGLSLETARRGAQEIDDADLREVGVTLPVALRPPRLAADGEAIRTKAELELGPQTRQVCTQRLGKVRNGRQALAVLSANQPQVRPAVVF